jgi:hypothetical protein
VISGVPSNTLSSAVWMLKASSSNATQPMVSAHPVGTNPFLFRSGMSNHSTHSIPSDINPFSYGIPDLTSHLSSSVLSSHVNPSFGFRDMMPPYSPFSFGRGHIPQSNPTIGGWNPPSSGPNHSFTFPGASAQMGGPSTYYISSIHPCSSMPIPTNDFIMENLPLTSSVSFGGSQFYSMGNHPHRYPSFGGNICPNMSNPYHVTFSSQEDSSIMIPLQNFTN